jgi:hypothetical protein
MQVSHETEGCTAPSGMFHLRGASGKGLHGIVAVHVSLTPTSCGTPRLQVATGGASHEQLPMVLRVPHAALGTNPAFALLGLGGWCCRGAAVLKVDICCSSTAEGGWGCG